VHVILSTVIFSDFNHADIRSNNYDKINIRRARLISIKWYKMFLYLKILQRILDKIVNTLTKHESGETISTKSSGVFLGLKFLPVSTIIMDKLP
jgi:hypothetical protein